MSPGPDIIYVFYKSSTSGFKEAAKLSIGLTSGLLIHTLFVVLGISTLIKSNQDLEKKIKVIQAKEKQLKLISALPNESENKQYFKNKIDYLIQEIDYCIDRISI